MKTVMTRCHGCNQTVKNADQFHQTCTEITGMPYNGWRDVGRTYYGVDTWCCDCVGHEVGKCKEQIVQDLYNMEFKQALVRSMGGVTRTGFLESDQQMKDYYKSRGVLRDA